MKSPSRPGTDPLQALSEGLPPEPMGLPMATLSPPIPSLSSVMGASVVDPVSQSGPGNASKNPSIRPGSVLPNGQRRIPMSVPRRKLEVSEIPGFHLHWFKEPNVGWALQGGYTFVESREMSVTQTNVGGDSETSGNQDLGSRIRVMSAITEGANPEYFVLMKTRQEWFDEDQREIAKRNMEIMRAIFRDKRILGPAGMHPSDADVRYVSKALFSRPLPKDV